MQAQDYLARLRASFKNTSIDWEFILECNYRTYLPADRPLGILDVGGHAARHSKVFLQSFQVRDLVIFEPLPQQFRALERLFADQRAVRVLPYALGNRTGTTRFFQNDTSPEESGLRKRSFYNDRASQRIREIDVQVERLDDLALAFKIDYIKIDTEGGEIDILRGAENLLRSNLPLVSAEFGIGGYDAFGHGPDALFDLATQFGYRVYDLFGNPFSDIAQWRACVSQYYWDYMLLPIAREQELSDRIARVKPRVLEACRARGLPLPD